MHRDSWFTRAEGAVHGWCVRHSIAALRISLGLIFLGFGALKFVPGLSPAEDLVLVTTRLLTLGLVPDGVALVVTAGLECVIGVSLILGRGLRLTIYLLVGELLGILSPLVLLPGRLFAGPLYAPTLEGQYVLKDIVLVAAAMVVVTTFRGARIALRIDTPPVRTSTGTNPTPGAVESAPGREPGRPAPGPTPPATVLRAAVCASTRRTPAPVD